MPYKDGRKEHLFQVSITINKTDEMLTAFKKAVAESGYTNSQYAKTAIREKLTRDGYLKEPEQQEQD